MEDFNRVSIGAKDPVPAGLGITGDRVSGCRALVLRGLQLMGSVPAYQPWCYFSPQGARHISLALLAMLAHPALSQACISVYIAVYRVCIYSWTSVFCNPCLRIRCRIGWRSKYQGQLRQPAPIPSPNSWEPGQSQDRPDNQAGFPTMRPSLTCHHWHGPKESWPWPSSLSSALVGVLHST